LYVKLINGQWIDLQTNQVITLPSTINTKTCNEGDILVWSKNFGTMAGKIKCKADSQLFAFCLTPLLGILSNIKI
jgi:hypothetical protein